MRTGTTWAAHRSCVSILIPGWGGSSVPVCSSCGSAQQGWGRANVHRKQNGCCCIAISSPWARSENGWAGREPPVCWHRGQSPALTPGQHSVHGCRALPWLSSADGRSSNFLRSACRFFSSLVSAAQPRHPWQLRLDSVWPHASSPGLPVNSGGGWWCVRQKKRSLAFRCRAQSPQRQAGKRSFHLYTWVSVTWEPGRLELILDHSGVYGTATEVGISGKLQAQERALSEERCFQYEPLQHPCTLASCAHAWLCRRLSSDLVPFSRFPGRDGCTTIFRCGQQHPGIGSITAYQDEHCGVFSVPTAPY